MSVATAVVGQPVTAAERIELLDVVRGFALLGVLIANLIWTATQLGQTEAERAAMPTAGIDQVASWLWQVVGHDKANTLFAFLFGLGFWVQLERATDRGVAFGRLYGRRLAVLFLIGLAHNYLVWFGDILHLYAMTGLVLLATRGWSNRTRLLVGLLFAIGWRPFFDFVSEAVPAIAAQVASLPAVYTDAAIVERQALLLSGSYPAIVEANVALTWADWIGSGVVLGWVGYAAGRFWLGSWVARRRFLHDADQFRAGWWRLLFLALPFGLLGNILGATLEARDIELDGALFWAVELAVAASVVALAAAYLAGLVLVFHSGARGRRWLGRLAPVGRMALTNYLAHSVLYVVALYGVGFGLLDDLGATACWALGLGYFAVQVAWSHWWLARYRFGPAEWLWRAATYGRAPAWRVGGNSGT